MTDPGTAIEVLPVEESVQTAIEEITNRAQQLVVSDLSSYDGAGVARRELATILRQLKSDTAYRKRPFLDASIAIQAEHNRLEKLLSDADKTIAQSMNAWRSAENARIAKEQAAVAAAAERERKRLENRAEKAAEKGDIEKAAQLEERAMDVQAPVLARVTQPAGISEREVWHFEVVDKSLIPLKYMAPDEKVIGAVVRAEKDLCDIPGIRVYKTTTDVRRSV